MDSKYCSSCNSEVMESMRICPICGCKDFVVELNEPQSSIPKSSNKVNFFEKAFTGIGYGLGGLGCIAFAIIGVVQIYAGFIGIEHEFGHGWAIAVIILSLLLRFSLPLTIGTFLCALNIWHWNWMLSALFAAPGLIFIVPGLLALIIGSVRK